MCLILWVGTGSSKKKAKHCAAQAALKEILGVTNGEFTAEEEKPQVKEENGG